MYMLVPYIAKMVLYYNVPLARAYYPIRQAGKQKNLAQREEMVHADDTRNFQGGVDAHPDYLNVTNIISFLQV